MKDEDVWRLWNIPTNHAPSDDACRLWDIPKTTPTSEQSQNAQNFGLGSDQSLYHSTPLPLGFFANGRTDGSEGSSSISVSVSDEDDAHGSVTPNSDVNGTFDNIGQTDHDAATMAANDFCRQCISGLAPLDVKKEPLDSFPPIDRRRTIFTPITIGSFSDYNSSRGPSIRSSTSTGPSFGSNTSTGPNIAETQAARWSENQTPLPPTEAELMSGYRPYHEYPPQRSTVPIWTATRISRYQDPLAHRLQEWNQQNPYYQLKQGTGSTNPNVNFGQLSSVGSPRPMYVEPWQPSFKPQDVNRSWSQVCFEPRRPSATATFPRVDPGDSVGLGMDHHPSHSPRFRNGQPSMSFPWADPYIQHQRTFLNGQTTGQSTSTKTELEKALEWMRQQNLHSRQKTEPSYNKAASTAYQFTEASCPRNPQDRVKDEDPCLSPVSDQEAVAAKTYKGLDISQKQLQANTVTRAEPNVMAMTLVRNWFSSERGSNDYVAYPTSPMQLMHREVTFYISSKQLDMDFQMTNFEINAVHLEGTVVNVRVSKDRNKPRSRLVCHFWAGYSGLHEVNVFLYDKMVHVDGSPFPIEVIRERVSMEEKVMTPVDSPTEFRNTFILHTSKLWGVVHNPMTNEVYATDRIGSKILVFLVHNDEMSLRSTWSLPNGVRLSDAFHPTGIALDVLHQRAFVTDKGNHCVVVFSCTGRYLTHFGRLGYADGDFSYPWGIAVSPDGEVVVVADSRNHRIQMLSSSGEFIRRYSAFEIKPYEYRRIFDQPRGVCFDSTGTRLFVTDFNVARTFEFNLTLTTMMTFGPEDITVRPQSISLDPSDGSFFICDSRRNLIRHLTSTGELFRTIDRSYHENFGVEMPIGACAVGRALCIVDRGGVRIRLIKYPADVN